MSNYLDLIDYFLDIGFTRNNRQIGLAYRAARIDRVYLSIDIRGNFTGVNCDFDRVVNLSDHVPIILECANPKAFVKVGWFHADALLLNVKCVKDKIIDIFHHAFSEHPSPIKGWITSVKIFQVSLHNFKKQAILACK